MQIPPFEVQTYIGSDIAQMRTDGDRPPRSAKLVASVDMGSGPGGGDYRTYLISTDRARKGWTLWIRGSDYDTGKSMHCYVAYGWPYRGVSARDAAEVLLAKSWVHERDLYGTWPPWITVQEPGLLTCDDIERIRSAVFDDEADLPAT